MSIKPYLDRVLEAYTVGPLYDEVKKAREEYCERTGRVAEGDETFENQMNSFLDWYLFDRPMDKDHISPVKLFVLERIEQIDPADREIFEDLAKSNHSLFELLKVKGEDVYLKDLFTGEKYIVEDSDVNRGFTKGDIFEARLIKFRDRLVFGNSFVFHPRTVRSFILKQIKAIKYLDASQRLRLIHKLASMRLKTEQYSHIDVQHIYTENPLF